MHLHLVRVRFVKVGWYYFLEYERSMSEWEWKCRGTFNRTGDSIPFHLWYWWAFMQDGKVLSFVLSLSSLACMCIVAVSSRVSHYGVRWCASE